MLVQMMDVRMLLMHRTGPTSFVVQEEMTAKKFKVAVGSSPTCTWCASHIPARAGCIFVKTGRHTHLPP